MGEANGFLKSTAEGRCQLSAAAPLTSPHLQESRTAATFAGMRKLLAPAGMALVVAGLALASPDWSVIRQGGRDYVTFSNVALLPISGVHPGQSHRFIAQGSDWHSGPGGDE